VAEVGQFRSLAALNSLANGCRSKAASDGLDHSERFGQEPWHLLLHEYIFMLTIAEGQRAYAIARTGDEFEEYLHVGRDADDAAFVVPA
jgi:hypothetical protein